MSYQIETLGDIKYGYKIPTEINPRGAFHKAKAVGT